VKDNLAHLALWDDLRADEVIRIAAGHATTLPMSGDQDASYNAMMYELRRALSLAQVQWELAHSLERLEAAIAAAPPETLDETRYGEAGLVSHHARLHAGYIDAWRQRMGY
jgi:hypothetical protein